MTTHQRDEQPNSCGLARRSLRLSPSALFFLALLAIIAVWPLRLSGGRRNRPVETPTAAQGHIESSDDRSQQPWDVVRRTCSDRKWTQRRQVLDWNVQLESAICMRGRRLLIDHGANASAVPKIWRNKRHVVPLEDFADPASWQGISIQSNGHASDASAGFVMHHPSEALVVASTFLHGFHVLVNTMIPVLHVLRSHSPGLLAPSTSFYVVLTRHKEYSPKFFGGEKFAAEMASPLASAFIDDDGALTQTRNMSRVAGSSASDVHVFGRIDGLEQDTQMHCFCTGVLHDMVNAEFVTSVPQSRRIALGDPMRRQSSEFVKAALNQRYGFVPYGTKPKDIPASELCSFGLWSSACGGTGAALRNQPRLLLLLRSATRVLGDATNITQMATSIGFLVHVMFPEQETLTLQARAARYSDVMVAVHGQALTWSLLMDASSPRAHHCREVVELMFFGKPLRGMQNVFEVIAADNYLRYQRIPPSAVEWLGDCSRDGCSGWRHVMLKAKYPQLRTAFNKQRVFFTTNEQASSALRAALEAVHTRVARCLSRLDEDVLSAADPLPPSYIAASDFAIPQYKS